MKESSSIIKTLDVKSLPISNVFRKAVFLEKHTGILLNFSAICPCRWKIGLINCMLYGAYNICCNWYSFTKEIEVLRDLFRQNGYPGVTFENCVKCFVDSKIIPCKRQTQQKGISQFITIPYFGHS